MTTRVRRKTKLLLEGVRQVRVVAIVTHKSYMIIAIDFTIFYVLPLLWQAQLACRHKFYCFYQTQHGITGYVQTCHNTHRYFKTVRDRDRERESVCVFWLRNIDHRLSNQVYNPIINLFTSVPAQLMQTHGNHCSKQVVVHARLATVPVEHQTISSS